MKKISLLFIAAALLFVSCGPRPDMTIHTEDEILEIMNKKFDGTFTLSSDNKTEQGNYSIRVYMDCRLENGTEFPVMTENYWMDTIFGYTEKNARFTTNYYSKRYESEINQASQEKVEAYFSDFVAEPGFKLLKDGTVNYMFSINDHYGSAEECINDLMTRSAYIEDYIAVFFTVKDENKDLEIRIAAYKYDAENHIGEVSGKYLKSYYDASYKTKPDELTLELVKSKDWQSSH